MRHRKRNNNLKRQSGHRKSMLANMSCSLIMHKRIKTTLAKAKVLKKFIEPIITRSKNDSTHNRRTTFRYLRQKSAVTELFSVVADKVANRPGGYTRIIKLGHRLGDAAEIAFIELVDFNEIYNIDEGKKKRTRRSRRSDKNKASGSDSVKRLAKDDTSVKDVSKDDTSVKDVSKDDTSNNDVGESGANQKEVDKESKETDSEE